MEKCVLLQVISARSELSLRNTVTQLYTRHVTLSSQSETSIFHSHVWLHKQKQAGVSIGRYNKRQHPHLLNHALSSFFHTQPLTHTNLLCYVTTAPSNGEAIIRPDHYQLSVLLQVSLFLLSASPCVCVCELVYVCVSVCSLCRF